MALIYWLHMLATVTWIGSLAAINLLVLPASTQTLKLVDQTQLYRRPSKKTRTLGMVQHGIVACDRLISTERKSAL